MKKFIISILAITGGFASAQVAVNMAPSGNSGVSLEYPVNQEKGIVVPYVLDINGVTGAVPGTIVLNQVNKQVYYKNNSSWVPLSTAPNTADLSQIFSAQNDETENANAKVSIGTPSAIPGILVLEATNKAMVLPREDTPETRIINPAPGMMVYDPTRDLLCVFNGHVWTYWKATN